MNATQTFAKNMKKLRKARALSQEKLADLCGLHRTYVGAVERAERNITLMKAQQIAKALGVSLAECLKE